MHRLGLHRLQIRLTLVMVVLIFVGLWSLALLMAERQEGALRELLAAQQSSAAGYLAEEIGRKVQLRRESIASIAAIVPVDALDDPEALLAFLRFRRVVYGLFDGGLVIMRLRDGRPHADYPPVRGRLDTRFDQLDCVRQAIATDAAAICRPYLDPLLKHPTLAVAAPSRHKDGTLAAVLIGFVSLGAPDFLNPLEDHHFGTSGDFHVIAPGERLIITGTHAGDALMPLSDEGRAPPHHSVLAGFEGSRIAPDAEGVERLISGRRVAGVDWFVLASTPTRDAFAPVHEMRRLAIGGASLLSALVGALAALLIQRNLRSLTSISRAFDDISQGRRSLHPLPLTRPDEVGMLVESFNRLQERLRAESAALEQQERLLRTVLDSTEDGILVIDATGRVLSENRRFAELWRVPEGLLRSGEDTALLRHVIQQLTDGPGFLREVRRLYDSAEENWSLVQFKDGRVFERYTRPLGPAAGEGRLWAFRDVTERKRVEAALESERTLLRTLFRTIPDPLWLKDPEGVYIACNSAFEALYGASQAQIIGRRDELFVAPELAELFRSKDREALAAGRPVVNEEWLICAGSGRRGLFETIKTALHGPKGEVIGVLGISREITERKQMEEALQRSERRARQIFANSSAVTLIIEPDGGAIVDANEAACQFYGYPREALLGRSITEINCLAPAEVHRHIGEAVSGARRYFNFQHRLASGAVREVEVYSGPVETPEGVLLYSIIHDITERKQAERALRESEAKLRLAASVFENSHEGLAITDAQANILEVNDAFTAITGYSREEVRGRNPRILRSGHQSREFYRSLWAALAAHGVWRGEIWNRRKDGAVYPQLLTISAVNDEQGRVSRYVGVFSDISTLKEHEQQLMRIAHYDALTGVPNRILLADRMQQAMAKCRREQRLLAVAYIDLDGFKAVNDSYGHETGDRLLMAVAERLLANLRGDDTVARLGGDEFVLLLGGLTRVAECEATLRRVLESMEPPVLLAGVELRLSLSIGVTLFPLDEAEPELLMRHADLAMYRAKRAGRGQYQFYDAALDHPPALPAATGSAGQIAAARREAIASIEG